MGIDTLIRQIIREEMNGINQGQLEFDYEKVEKEAKQEKINAILGIEPKPEKIYKGFYFDKDIAHFLDKIQNGNKSELINAIIRAYLTENDLWNVNK